ncbi:MAG TPA: right-handed parallel beta-helix repeat-containing protein, partial [Nitrospiria bacterium]|nr:right-handed parallel beta-helix repeat-containing protein [Nitrospiria bacterium]
RLAFVHEYSGLAASPSLDQASSGGGNNSTPSSGATPVTTQADELVIGAVSVADGNNAVINTDGNFPGGPFKLSQGAGSYPRSLSTQYRIVSATASYTFAPTLTAGRLWAAGIATYKAATALTCTVTNTNDAAAGSLRDCITYANSNPGTTISFNIPDTDGGFIDNAPAGPGGNDYWRIQPNSGGQGALPPITASGTIIDGSTQRVNYGSDTNGLGPEIEINGALAGSVNGLSFTSNNNTLNEIIVNGFAGNPGVRLTGDGNSVNNNYIGTNYSGTTADANGYGVFVSGGTGNHFIGTAGNGNVLSGNSFYGILIAAGTGTDVKGNFIGTNAAGASPIPNSIDGIFVQTNSNIIGGTGAGEENVISGNTGEGIELLGASFTTIRGNLIGTDPGGTLDIGNGGDGIRISGASTDNAIGGTAGDEGNVISGNGGSGIELFGTGPADNGIYGNYIGTNAAGTTAIPNQASGVFIQDGPSGTLIGSSTGSGGNVISGNVGNG